jgi:hypothetical protein
VEWKGLQGARNEGCICQVDISTELTGWIYYNAEFGDAEILSYAIPIIILKI